MATLLDGVVLAPASGTNVFLTSLVFHVIDGAGEPPLIDVSLGTTSNILMANGALVDASQVPIRQLPEPLTGLFLGLGVAVSALAQRRQSNGRASVPASEPLGTSHTPLP